MYKVFKKTVELAGGRTIGIETGKLAKQADGSVVIQMGDTVLLATVVAAKNAKENVDFMPLSVEYREQFSANGRFPGGFLKREGRPGDNEILVSRLIDRVLRPLFPSDYHADVFVSVSLLSAGGEIMPDALAAFAASAALTLTDIPFEGPISEVRVARVDGNFVVNPTFEELAKADIDMMVGATIENVMMVEGEMSEVSEADMLEAIKVAHDAIKVQCQAQLDLAEMVGKQETREYNHEENNDELRQLTHEKNYAKVYEIAKSGLAKHERSEAAALVKEEFFNELDIEANGLNENMLSRYFHDVEKQAARNLLLDESIRLDGRKTDEIRPIWGEVDYLPQPHGSAVFTRGETQALATVTLGTKMDEKMIDNVLLQTTEKFVLHYNFPPFSTGDARPVRGVSRREIGHGNLALRALKTMIPDDNPYAIRVVSTILESNGSSSMATVCAGTMALMDAGVQIKKPVSGIAMGLITGENGKYAILSDILGDEDHLGDMDFKVTGTADGITACQMDIKVDGLSYEILEQALEQAKQGRLHILGKIIETIEKPRADYKPHVPRIEKIMIPKDMIGAVIGPGGKVIQKIQAETETVITIEENDQMGEVSISAPNKSAIQLALKRVQAIVAIPEEGEIYEGIVKTVVPFGAFVEIMPGKEGLLHISEIEHRRLETVEEVLKEGDKVTVKLLEVDKRSGKLRLSRKALLPRPARKR